ncbi:MAG TPA: methyl-accepting chemotaxis protein [Thermoanaerobaculia bacterium]|nr:methyl-accepting chemotaxis protein [Thermoanaerobaculia bacterium]
MARSIRGSAVKLTLPYVLRYLGLWLVVTILVVLGFSITSYLVLADRLAGAELRRVAMVLLIQAVCVLLAIVALALFTTHRLAGPFIALKRACEDIQAGDLTRRLHFRRTDAHLVEVETAFNEMVESLEGRVGAAAGREGGGGT